MTFDFFSNFIFHYISQLCVIKNIHIPWNVSIAYVMGIIFESEL